MPDADMWLPMTIDKAQEAVGAHHSTLDTLVIYFIQDNSYNRGMRKYARANGAEGLSADGIYRFNNIALVSTGTGDDVIVRQAHTMMLNVNVEDKKVISCMSMGGGTLWRRVCAQDEHVRVVDMRELVKGALMAQGIATVCTPLVFVWQGTFKALRGNVIIRKGKVAPRWSSARELQIGQTRIRTFFRRRAASNAA